MSHQLCPFGTTLESTQNMLRFEIFFDFWKISFNSTGRVKKVLENSRNWKFFPNVPKNYPESTFDFFGIWLIEGFSSQNPQWGKKKIFFCLIEGLHVKTITHSDSKKKSKGDSGKFFGTLEKNFSFWEFFKTFFTHPVELVWIFQKSKNFSNWSMFRALSKEVPMLHNWWDTPYK